MFIQPAVASMSIKLFSLPQLSKPPKVSSLLTRKSDSLLSTVISDISSSGFLIIPTLMSAWNLSESIGSSSLTFWEDRIHITIANPKWVKAVKGNKDDTKDSKWIGDLFRLGLVPGSLILTAVYQMLSTGETWNLYDLYKTDMPQQMQDKQKVKAVKQALKLLISEGMLSPESASTAV